MVISKGEKEKHTFKHRMEMLACQFQHIIFKRFMIEVRSCLHNNFEGTEVIGLMQPGTNNVGV